MLGVSPRRVEGDRTPSAMAGHPIAEDGRVSLAEPAVDDGLVRIRAARDRVVDRVLPPRAGGGG